MQSWGHVRNGDCILHPQGMLIPLKGAGISSSQRLPFPAGQRQNWRLQPASLPRRMSIPAFQATSQLVSGLFSDTVNGDICLCQMSQKGCPVISRKCSELPNARVKGIGHSDGSLPLTAFSEPYYCNLTQTCLSSSWACSAQVTCWMGVLLINSGFSLTLTDVLWEGHKRASTGNLGVTSNGF